VTLLIALTLFVLAVFLGLELINKVPATLHTPLMSGSNAVSGITLIGAMVSAGIDHSTLTTTLGFVAVVLATINVVGGFLVTGRMLAMFTPKRESGRERRQRHVDRLPGCRRPFHPRPQGPRSAPHGPPGKSARGIGDAGRRPGHPA